MELKSQRLFSAQEFIGPLIWHVCLGTAAMPWGKWLRDVPKATASSFFCGNFISWDPSFAIAQLPLNSPTERNLDTATSICLSSSSHIPEMPSKGKVRTILWVLFCTTALLGCSLQRSGCRAHVPPHCFWMRRPAAISPCLAVPCWGDAVRDGYTCDLELGCSLRHRK